jgi:hypothetical protein
MKQSVLAVVVLVAWHSTARAYWPTTEVTRQKAQREKLPLSVSVLPLGDSTVEVKYQVTLTGPFAHLQSAEILVSDGDRTALRFPVAPTVGPDGISPGPVKGHFQIQRDMLRRCRLRLDCPVEPLSESGQTFSIDLSSYLK